MLLFILRITIAPVALGAQFFDQMLSFEHHVVLQALESSQQVHVLQIVVVVVA
jgi:hypothetical protein